MVLLFSSSLLYAATELVCSTCVMFMLQDGKAAGGNMKRATATEQFQFNLQVLAVLDV